MAAKPDNIILCITCKHYGEIVDIDGLKGFLIHHPGRTFPCRAPWPEFDPPADEALAHGPVHVGDLVPT